MNIIEALKAKIETFNDGLTDGSYMSDIIKEYAAEIIDMNVEDQLFERGVNRLNVDIMDYKPYHPLTIELKKVKGQPYNRVTLRDEGYFHRSFHLLIGSDNFEITATDEKTEWLKKRYGRQIFGLTEDNARDLAESYVQPDLIKKLKEILNG